MCMHYMKVWPLFNYCEQAETDFVSKYLCDNNITAKVDINL